MFKRQIVRMLILFMSVLLAACKQQEESPKQEERRATAVKYCSGKYRGDTGEKIITVECSSPTDKCDCLRAEGLGRVQCGSNSENAGGSHPTFVEGSCQIDIVSR
jgi:hypothetical protein